MKVLHVWTENHNKLSVSLHAVELRRWPVVRRFVLTLKGPN